MLVDSSEQASTPAPGNLPRPGTAEQRERALCFGGIGFELSWERGYPFELSELESDCCMPVGTVPVAAHLECSIRWAEDDILRPVEVTAQGQSVRAFRGLGTQGVLREVAAGRYRAELTVTPTPRGCGAALRILAGLVLESTGGLCLHAAAVEVDGGAVLFTGPSGAGKSTACELSGADRCLAYDHVALVPTVEGYDAWRIPMGEPSSLPLTVGPVLLLRGILQVQHGEGEPCIVAHDPMRALFDARRAIDVADPAEAAEAARLDAAQRLCEHAPVTRVETVLGQPINQLLSDWLGAEVVRG